MDNGKQNLWTFTRSIFLAILCFFFISPGNIIAATGDKPIELSFALHIPPKAGPYTDAFLPWAEELEKASNGRLKIKFYLSSTLVKARDAYDAVKMGVADITWVPFSLNRGRFPLSSVMELPFLSTDTYTGSHALTDLYKKFPEMSAELNDVHLLSLWVSLPYEIHTDKKPITKLEDIKGMKLATQPGASKALEGVGAVPVTTDVPEMYPMLEKGVVDGTALAWGALKAFKLYEVTKYHTNPHLGGVPYAHVMNSSKWQQLPDDLKSIMTEVTDRMFPDILCKAASTEQNQGFEIVKEKGQEIIELSNEEQKRWVDTAKTSWDSWAEEMDKKGLPGKAILGETLRLVEKYKAYNKN